MWDTTLGDLLRSINNFCDLSGSAAIIEKQAEIACILIYGSETTNKTNQVTEKTFNSTAIAQLLFKESLVISPH